MRAYPRDTGRPQRGGRGGVQWDETILLNADSHSAGWRRDARFPRPSPKARSRSSPFAAYARSSGHKEDGLRGHMLHPQKRCQARMLFRGDTTIISPSSPGSLSGLQGCNFEMDFTAADSKMAQFVFPISASSPITMEICIPASVTGCIKYAAGLNAQNGELQNVRTAANVGSG